MVFQEYSTYDNQNHRDIDRMRRYQIQQDRISAFSVTERQFLSKKAQEYASRRQQGEFGHHCVHELVHRCSHPPHLEVILACNSLEYHCPFQRKLDLHYNGPISLNELLANSKSRAESPCFPQHQRTTNETAKTDKSPLSPIKGQANSIPKQEEQSAGKLPELEYLQNTSTGRLCNVKKNHEGPTGTKLQEISATRRSPLWDPRESQDSKVSQIKQNIESDSRGEFPKKRWLACPWYKKDPLKYSNCAKYKLLRIKDVKQHTYRRHMKPTICCSVCFRVFSREKERDRHAQERTCTPRNKPEFDGLSEQQRKELNQSANRGTDDAERWYCMWDMIFPGSRRPLLPYLGVGRQELLPLLRSFWYQRHQEIICDVLQRSSQRKLEPEIIQNVMDIIFDRFEAESLLWDSYPNEHSGDELPETSNSRAQSPGISNDITMGGSTPQQDITDYGTSYEPGLESNFLEHMSESDFDKYFDIRPGIKLDPYGIGY